MYIDFLTAPDELEPTEACTIDIMTPVSSSAREESLCNDACLYPADNTPEVHSTRTFTRGACTCVQILAP